MPLFCSCVSKAKDIYKEKNIFQNVKSEKQYQINKSNIYMLGKCVFFFAFCIYLTIAPVYTHKGDIFIALSNLCSPKNHNNGF